MQEYRLGAVGGTVSDVLSGGVGKFNGGNKLLVKVTGSDVGVAIGEQKDK